MYCYKLLYIIVPSNIPNTGEPIWIPKFISNLCIVRLKDKAAVIHSSQLFTKSLLSTGTVPGAVIGKVLRHCPSTFAAWDGQTHWADQTHCTRMGCREVRRRGCRQQPSLASAAEEGTQWGGVWKSWKESHPRHGFARLLSGCRRPDSSGPLGL